MDSRELIARFRELSKIYGIEIAIETYDIYRLLTTIQEDFVMSYVKGEDRSDDRFKKITPLIKSEDNIIPYYMKDIGLAVGTISLCNVDLEEIEDYLDLVSIGANICSVRYGPLSTLTQHPINNTEQRRGVISNASYDESYKQVKIVSQDSVPAIFMNPYTGPSKRNPIGIFDGNKIIMYSTQTFLINSVDIKYISKPLEVTDTQSLTVAKEVHEDIVNAAVKTLLPQPIS